METTPLVFTLFYALRVLQNTMETTYRRMWHYPTVILVYFKKAVINCFEHT